MKCGFCELEFDQSEGKQSCGGCRGGCHSVHCPRCNYKNPLEPEYFKKVRSLFTKNDTHKGDGT